MSSNAVKQLRAALKKIPGAWVRIWRDGARWAGSRQKTRAAMLEVKAALVSAGFPCECTGSPGTEGEFIIEVGPLSHHNAAPDRLRRARAETTGAITTEGMRLSRKSAHMAIKNGSTVKFIRAGVKMKGILKSKSKPTGTGRGKYERGVIELPNGKKVTMPTAGLTEVITA